MSKKFRTAIFKLIDILVIFTMVSASPMSMVTSAMAQEASAVLATDKADYSPGESAHVTGSGFAAGDYVLAANGTAWGPVTADEAGNFAADSPALDSAGSYEVRAYAAPWSGDWNEAPLASASFTVTAPLPPTETPTQEPTAAPTDTPTTEPTAAPTDTPTSEPTVAPTDTPTAEPTPLPPPFIQSDKADYAPGELVTLTGGNWQGDLAVRIVVNDDIGQAWRRDVTVSVALDGTISDSFNLPSFFIANYSVTATGQQTGRVAITSFTDVSIGTYDQCSNDDGNGYATGDTDCRWINGNLQSNNSTYFEGDATVQRLWLTGFVPGSTHTVRLKYGTTKGGKHAYDFLTTWDWSENWIPLADRCHVVRKS